MSELDKKMMEYSKRFDDGFPMIPLGWGRTDEQVIEIIDKCLEKGKDAYAMGYVDDDPDVDY